jgi:hypothetical protein
MADINHLTLTIHLTAYYLLPDERTAMNENSISRFTLVHGYLSSESNFHYAELSGFDANNDPCWIMSYSDLPEGATIIPVECAESMIRNITPRELRNVVT